MKYYFGVDLGGTTTKMGLFQADGTLVEKWEIPTRRRQKIDVVLVCGTIPGIQKITAAMIYLCFKCHLLLRKIV